MSALPGHDRISQDDELELARATEHEPTAPVNAPGRDLLAELEQAVRDDPRSSR